MIEKNEITHLHTCVHLTDAQRLGHGTKGRMGCKANAAGVRARIVRCSAGHAGRKREGLFLYWNTTHHKSTFNRSIRICIHTHMFIQILIHTCAHSFAISLSSSAAVSQGYIHIYMYTYSLYWYWCNRSKRNSPVALHEARLDVFISFTHLQTLCIRIHIDKCICIDIYMYTGWHMYTWNLFNLQGYTVHAHMYAWCEYMCIWT